jgi:hypothetical protein
MSSPSMWYEPLDATALQIRLVTIEPSELNDDINCTLNIASLDDHSPYEALSYFWGDPNVTKTILLNSRPFEVTLNLESALRHLRLGELRTMWIDAICINQQDLQERGSQVKQIQKVYESAMSTFVWLGDATPLSRKAFEFLYAVPILVSPEKTSRSTVKEFSQERIEPFEDLFCNEAAVEGNKALKVDISLCPWWKRVWVIQELAVSNHVVLKCGMDEIHWPRFFKFYPDGE